jgi:hypothetical protein
MSLKDQHAYEQDYRKYLKQMRLAVRRAMGRWMHKASEQKDRVFIRDFFAKCKEVLFC